MKTMKNEVSFSEDILPTPQEMTPEEIKQSNQAAAKANYSWYERFTMKRILSSMRHRLLKKHDKKRRPDAIKLIIATQEFLFIAPDGSDDEYTKEQLQMLPIDEIEKILIDIIAELEAIL